jgi:putative addiction module killer protein
VIQLLECVNEKGVSPYTVWLESLDPAVRARVLVSVFRLASGNFSACKGAGGIFELRLDFGPGYRIYFGKDGEFVVLLLGGGTKKRQQKDIEDARLLWKQYKRQKTGKTTRGVQ